MSDVPRFSTLVQFKFSLELQFEMQKYHVGEEPSKPSKLEKRNQCKLMMTVMIIIMLTIMMRMKI